MANVVLIFQEATNLPCREYQSSLEPYLVVDVLNNKWSLQKSERTVHTVQTRVVRHTHNPKFDQKFTFDVRKIEVKVKSGKIASSIRQRVSTTMSSTMISLLSVKIKSKFVRVRATTTAYILGTIVAELVLWNG